MERYALEAHPVRREEVLAWCANAMAVDTFRDYAPNGLQVEGHPEVRHIVCAVTASRFVIESAVAQQADTVLVHHGMFWKSEPAVVVGWKKNRLAALLKNDINLIAYHLPLDAQPQWGNNAQLAKQMGWQIEGQCGEQDLLMFGTTTQVQTAAQLGGQLTQVLGREPTVCSPDKNKLIRRLAWCTGGAQSYFAEAAAAGVDAFVTGEISEAQYHLAAECGVAFFAAGHHATEKFGIQALGAQLEAQFNLKVTFVDEPNPA